MIIRSLSSLKRFSHLVLPQMSDKDPQQLTLKVMRLSRPTMVSSGTPLYIEPSSNALKQGHAALSRLQDLDAQTLGLVDFSDMMPLPRLQKPPSSPTKPSPLSKTPSTVSAQMDLLTGAPSPILQQPFSLRLRDFALGSMLSLPTSFGNIYMGETFSCYLCLNNDSKTANALDVDFKVELQSSSQRFPLFDTKPAAVSASAANISPTPSATSPTLIRPSQTLEATVSHEIKELGVHILVCAISYTPENAPNERKSFRKFYKFQVLNPLAVKTKVHSFPSQIFLEAQVQNLTANAITMERFMLNPHDGYACKAVDDGSSSQRVFLKPKDVKQFLFRLTPKSVADEHAARTNTSLGRLDVAWRSALGEPGSLETNYISRKAPAAASMELVATHVPSEIYLEEPFTVQCRVTNLKTTECLHVSITAQKSKMVSVLLAGEATEYIGEIRPQESVACSLTFFPLVPGLQRIEGLTLTDSLSGEAVPVESFADVYIERAHLDR